MIEFLASALFDLLTDDSSGRLHFVAGNHAIIVVVDRLALFPSEASPQVPDGLAFLLVDLVVLVGVEAFQKLRQIVIFGGFF